MRRVGLTVENFRCYRPPTSVQFNDLTAFVGSNDVGKWSLMDALARHPTTEGHADLLSLKRDDLAKRATDLKVDLASIDRRKNADVRRAIWAAFDDLKQAESLVSLDAEGGRQVIVTTHTPMLARYLDATDLRFIKDGGLLRISMMYPHWWPGPCMTRLVAFPRRKLTPKNERGKRAKRSGS